MNNQTNSFQAATAAANAAGGAFRERDDIRTIDQIINIASRTGNEGAKNDLMSKLLSRVSPERRPEALRVIQRREEEMKARQARDRTEAAYKSIGRDPSEAYLPAGVQTERERGRNQQNKPVEQKPSLIEKAQLQNLGESARKLPGAIKDLERALELTKEGAPTGPIRGGKYEWEIGKFFKPESIQELDAIGARRLVGSFTTLPRIVSEFESFKGGQISSKLSPAVLERNIKDQLAAAYLEKRNIDRIQELQNQGMSEVMAFRQAVAETAEEEAKLLNNIQSTKQQAEAEAGGQGQDRQAQLDALLAS